MKRRWLTALLAVTLAFGGSASVLAAETDGGAAGNVVGEGAGDEVTASETYGEPEIEIPEEVEVVDSQELDSVWVEEDENPVEAAENEEIVAAEIFSEVDANGLAWNLEGGVLTISGNGMIEENPVPVDLKDEVISVVIREGVTGIGKEAFSYYHYVEHISIPGSVREIGEFAFYFDDLLTSVNLPAGLTEIKVGTFGYCWSLAEISIPDGVTKIGGFNNCGALTSISIPESVTEIDDYAFANSGLTSISIPENVIKIGRGAFAHCTSLTEISIPKGITEIQCNTFADCLELRRVTIPNQVTKIGDMAFWGCPNLLEITIPNSVKSIGQATFAHCQRLQTVTFKGDAPKIIKENEYSSDEAPFEDVLNGIAYYPLAIRPIQKKSKQHTAQA